MSRIAVLHGLLNILSSFGGTVLVTPFRSACPFTPSMLFSSSAQRLNSLVLKRIC
jgi:hypothetical protein